MSSDVEVFIYNRSVFGFLFQGDAIVIGCLKSAHQSFNLTDENMEKVNGSEIIKSYEFGSPVCSFNIIDNNGQSVALATESRIGMKFDLLPTVSTLPSLR